MILVFYHPFQKAWMQSVIVSWKASQLDTRLSTLVSPTAEPNSNRSLAPSERALIVLREGQAESVRSSQRSVSIHYGNSVPNLVHISTSPRHGNAFCLCRWLWKNRVGATLRNFSQWNDHTGRDLPPSTAKPVKSALATTGPGCFSVGWDPGMLVGNCGVSPWQ